MPAFADARVSTAGIGALIGTASSAVSANSITVIVNGIEVIARTLTGVSPSVGQSVMLQRIGSNWFVVGVIPAVPVAAPPPPAIPPDRPPTDTPPPPKPKVRTGTLVVVPVSTATYRAGKWRSDTGHSVDSADTYQGNWGSGLGINTGCAFYGGKPTSLKGATVTRIAIKMRRIQGGVFGGQTMTLRLITQSRRPTGAPSLNESTAGPRLAVGGSVSTFILPNSWGTLLINGSRGGIGCFVSGSSPYIVTAGRGSWSSAWVLSISWRRG